MCSPQEYFERINLKPKREFEDGNAYDQHFMVAESRFHRMLAASNISSHAYKIDSVDLIKNEKLWTRFKAKQQQFEKAGKNSKPLMIFHGTPGQNIDSIVKNNFTVSNIVNGRVYGDGVYFSECPEISIKYSLGTNQLILCQVLLGNTMKGKLSPGFDSTEVIKKGEERCYAIVVPDVDQIFPCYVINFSQSAHNRASPVVQQPCYQQINKPLTKIIAGHYRLRRQEEFGFNLAGMQQERMAFETFLKNAGLSSDDTKTYMSLTNMYIREEMNGNENIYFHHRNDADETVCTEVVNPGVQTVEPSAFQSGILCNCIWQRRGDSLHTTLEKSCEPQQPAGTHGSTLKIFREFRDNTLVTTYTVFKYVSFYQKYSFDSRCSLTYVKIS